LFRIWKLNILLVSIGFFSNIGLRAIGNSSPFFYSIAIKTRKKTNQQKPTNKAPLRYLILSAHSLSVETILAVMNTIITTIKRLPINIITNNHKKLLAKVLLPYPMRVLFVAQKTARE
jgi:hypothetical protein